MMIAVDSGELWLSTGGGWFRFMVSHLVLSPHCSQLGIPSSSPTLPSATLQLAPHTHCDFVIFGVAFPGRASDCKFPKTNSKHNNKTLEKVFLKNLGLTSRVGFEELQRLNQSENRHHKWCFSTSWYPVTSVPFGLSLVTARRTPVGRSLFGQLTWVVKKSTSLSWFIQ